MIESWALRLTIFNTYCFISFSIRSISVITSKIKNRFQFIMLKFSHHNFKDNTYYPGEFHELGFK